MSGGSRLRIVAGELGGRRLPAPPPEGARPSSERTREAVFSILGPLGEERVLDLYCGTGAYALEALSRGARRATLVDIDVAAASENAEALGVGGRCSIERADALRWLGRGGSAYDLVFCDPPYRLADRLGPELDKLLPPRLLPGARVITESAPAAPLELSLPLLRERRYGSALVRVHAERAS
jgi:16S rRNA (guanine966-N2)-methyltransferase